MLGERRLRFPDSLPDSADCYLSAVFFTNETHHNIITGSNFALGVCSSEVVLGAQVPRNHVQRGEDTG